MNANFASAVAVVQDASKRIAEMFANLRTQRDFAIRQNARLDSLAPEITCPMCKNSVTTDVINPLPRIEALDALPEDFRPVDHKNLVCEECDTILYAPPHHHFRRRAVDFHEAAKLLKPKGDAIVTAHLLHHAAELYLKSLGAYEVHGRAEPEDTETVEGAVLEHKGHELGDLYDKLPGFVKAKLEATQGSRKLVRQVKSLPRRLSVTLRYGAVLKPPPPPNLLISDGTVFLPSEQNLTRILERLCDALSCIRRFD